jgi:hypothetical protein
LRWVRVSFVPTALSVYEDAPKNYLLDYAFLNGGVPGLPTFAPLLGLNARGETIFSYRYPTISCTKAYRALPIHLENTKFPTVGPQALNLSARGLVSIGDNVLIGGFIVSGTEPKTMVLRALGPSLSGFGLSDVLSDPVLSVYNSSHTLIATNDNWQADPNQFEIQANGLAPANLLESATVQTLAPGAYTVIVRGKDPTPGIGLVELCDLSPLSNSKLVNISTRGSVGATDDVLISGFIVGDVNNATVIVRALGPSLASFGVNGVLSDPTLTIYDSTGALIASNDNWHDNVNAVDVQRNGTRAAKSIGIGPRASPARRKIYRHCTWSRWRYGRCLSRSLHPPLIRKRSSGVDGSRVRGSLCDAETTANCWACNQPRDNR